MATCVGKFGDTSGAALELVTYWTYRTIKELRQQIAKEIGIVKLCLVSTVMRDDAGFRNQLLHVQVKLQLISTLGCMHFRNMTASMGFQ